VTSDRAEPIATALASVSSDALIAFLQRQRWFSAKGATLSKARLSSSVIAPWGDGAFALGRATVAAGGVEQVYQLPLATRASVPADVPAIGVLSASPVLYDAVYDSDFRTGLANALAAGATAGDGSAKWIAEAGHPNRFVVPADVATTIGSAEQSNTSIVIGDFAIVKLFRTLRPGIHPDVEVTRFLTTRAGFANTPALLASMRFEDDVGSTTSGMVQTFLPGSSDAWSYALMKAKSYFVGGKEPVNSFIEDARRLGAVTRAMHDALASDDADPAFAPDPATPEDLDRWVDRVTSSVRETLALLDSQLRAPRFPKERLAEARALLGRRDHFVAWVEEIADALGDDLGMCIRVHGDYHLGQVLRTASGDFSVIDFEGEPSRSLEERRDKTSPVRDVAGMLRSFAYAAATLAMSAERALDMPTRELRTARWERDTRAAFLAGYLGNADDDAPGVLPEDLEHVHLLIALFEAEKAFYELAYELNNRPDWSWIPMRGISKLLTKR
jgi:trehalose synthase-fused probable maltokinase